MSLSFKYTTTLPDYTHFDQATINYLMAGDVNRNKQFSDQVYGLIFLIVFLAAVAMIAAIVQVDFSVFSFALGIGFYIFMTRFKVRQIRNKVTPRPDCSLFGEHEMTLDERSFTVKTETSTTTTSWNVVTGVQEDERYFYIFPDTLRGTYIPKRDLASAELVHQVRTYLYDRLKQ